jgi:hypothetical protein
MLLLALLACCSKSDKNPDYSCSIEPVAVLALDDSGPLDFSPLEVLDVLDSLEGTLTWELETETVHEYRQVSERAVWTLTPFPGTVVDHVRFVDIDPGGCASLMEGAYAGDAMRFRSVLVDIQSEDSSNHIGGLVDIFVMDDATWGATGFVWQENMAILLAASDDLAESLDYSAERSVISDDDWRARPWLHGPLSDLAIGIDMVGSIEGLTGTALTGGADADFDLGVDPTDSLLP